MIDRPAQDLLDSIFRLATELVRGERMSLLLREEHSTDFVIARAIGLAEDVKREARVRVGVGVAGRVAATRQAILVGGPAGGHVPAEGENRRYRSDSFMVVPIVIDGEARGVINVADRA
ncbi:MAG: GAF domain-containing protein, partial [Phycisphaerales bacterium]|nr:GAF domain-containing protein [Phycisphaerales bacterium]